MTLKMEVKKPLIPFQILEAVVWIFVHAVLRNVLIAVTTFVNKV